MSSSSQENRLPTALMQEFKELEEIWEFQKILLARFKNVKIAFIILDSKNLGFLSFDDFSRSLISKGFPNEKAKHENLFKFLDKDRDGKITLDHWTEGFQNIGERLAKIKDGILSHARTPSQSVVSPLKMLKDSSVLEFSVSKGFQDSHSNAENNKETIRPHQNQSFKKVLGDRSFNRENPGLAVSVQQNSLTASPQGISNYHSPLYPKSTYSQEDYVPHFARSSPFGLSHLERDPGNTENIGIRLQDNYGSDLVASPRFEDLGDSRGITENENITKINFNNPVKNNREISKPLVQTVKIENSANGYSRPYSLQEEPQEKSASMLDKRESPKNVFRGSLGGNLENEVEEQQMKETTREVQERVQELEQEDLFGSKGSKTVFDTLHEHGDKIVRSLIPSLQASMHKVRIEENSMIGASPVIERYGGSGLTSLRKDKSMEEKLAESRMEHFIEDSGRNKQGFEDSDRELMRRREDYIQSQYQENDGVIRNLENRLLEEKRLEAANEGFKVEEIAAKASEEYRNVENGPGNIQRNNRGEARSLFESGNSEDTRKGSVIRPHIKIDVGVGDNVENYNELNMRTDMSGEVWTARNTGQNFEFSEIQTQSQRENKQENSEKDKKEVDSNVDIKHNIESLEDWNTDSKPGIDDFKGTQQRNDFERDFWRQPSNNQARFKLDFKAGGLHIPDIPPNVATKYHGDVKHSAKILDNLINNDNALANAEGYNYSREPRLGLTMEDLHRSAPLESAGDKQMGVSGKKQRVSMVDVGIVTEYKKEQKENLSQYVDQKSSVNKESTLQNTVVKLQEVDEESLYSIPDKLAQGLKTKQRSSQALFGEMWTKFSKDEPQKETFKAQTCQEPPLVDKPKEIEDVLKGNGNIPKEENDRCSQAPVETTQVYHPIHRMTPIKGFNMSPNTQIRQEFVGAQESPNDLIKMMNPPCSQKVKELVLTPGINIEDLESLHEDPSREYSLNVTAGWEAGEEQQRNTVEKFPGTMPEIVEIEEESETPVYTPVASQNKSCGPQGRNQEGSLENVKKVVEKESLPEVSKTGGEVDRDKFLNELRHIQEEIKANIMKMSKVEEKVEKELESKQTVKKECKEDEKEKSLRESTKDETKQDVRPVESKEIETKENKNEKEPKHVLEVRGESKMEKSLVKEGELFEGEQKTQLKEGSPQKDSGDVKKGVKNALDVEKEIRDEKREIGTRTWFNNKEVKEEVERVEVPELMHGLKDMVKNSKSGTNTEHKNEVLLYKENRKLEVFKEDHLEEESKFIQEVTPKGSIKMVPEKFKSVQTRNKVTETKVLENLLIKEEQEERSGEKPKKERVEEVKGMVVKAKDGDDSERVIVLDAGRKSLEEPKLKRLSHQETEKLEVKKLQEPGLNRREIIAEKIKSQSNILDMLKNLPEIPTRKLKTPTSFDLKDLAITQDIVLKQNEIRSPSMNSFMMNSKEEFQGTKSMETLGLGIVDRLSENITKSHNVEAIRLPQEKLDREETMLNVPRDVQPQHRQEISPLKDDLNEKNKALERRREVQDTVQKQPEVKLHSSNDLKIKALEETQVTKSTRPLINSLEDNKPFEKIDIEEDMLNMLDNIKIQQIEEISPLYENLTARSRSREKRNVQDTIQKLPEMKSPGANSLRINVKEETQVTKSLGTLRIGIMDISDGSSTIKIQNRNIQSNNPQEEAGREEARTHLLWNIKHEQRKDLSPLSENMTSKNKTLAKRSIFEEVVEEVLGKDFKAETARTKKQEDKVTAQTPHVDSLILNTKGESNKEVKPLHSSVEPEKIKNHCLLESRGESARKRESTFKELEEMLDKAQKQKESKSNLKSLDYLSPKMSGRMVNSTCESTRAESNSMKEINSMLHQHKEASEGTHRTGFTEEILSKIETLLQRRDSREQQSQQGESSTTKDKIKPLSLSKSHISCSEVERSHDSISPYSNRAQQKPRQLLKENEEPKEFYRGGAQEVVRRTREFRSLQNLLLGNEGKEGSEIKGKDLRGREERDIEDTGEIEHQESRKIIRKNSFLPIGGEHKRSETIQIPRAQEEKEDIRERIKISRSPRSFLDNFMESNVLKSNKNKEDVGKEERKFLESHSLTDVFRKSEEEREDRASKLKARMLNISAKMNTKQEETAMERRDLKERLGKQEDNRFKRYTVEPEAFVRYGEEKEELNRMRYRVLNSMENIEGDGEDTYSERVRYFTNEVNQRRRIKEQEMLLQQANKDEEILEALMAGLGTFNLKVKAEKEEKERSDVLDKIIRGRTINEIVKEDMSGVGKTYLISELARLEAVNKQLNKVNDSLKKFDSQSWK